MENAKMKSVIVYYDAYADQLASAHPVEFAYFKSLCLKYHEGAISICQLSSVDLLPWLPFWFRKISRDAGWFK